MSAATACFSCHAPSESPAARFCEECGAPFAHEPEPPAAPAPASPTACAKCGADPLDLDADGFCQACGMKPPAKPAARAHVELSAAFACASDVGRRHAVNQDAACIARCGPWALMAVADGVSSAHLSERASQEASQAWLARASELLSAGAPPEQAMAEGLAAAHAATLLIPYDPGSTRLEEPETTIVASICDPRRVILGWAGDSRAYGFLPGGSQGRLLTRDDSWQQGAIDAGLSPEAAERDPRAHAITQCLGTRDAAPVPHVESVDLREGESLLLCSDGLWNYFPDPGQIGASLAGGSALSVCEELASRANAAGGRDNITIALWVQGAGAQA